MTEDSIPQYEMRLKKFLRYDIILHPNRVRIPKNQRKQTFAHKLPLLLTHVLLLAHPWLKGLQHGYLKEDSEFRILKKGSFRCEQKEPRTNTIMAC
jgi:hypothetical protein